MVKVVDYNLGNCILKLNASQNFSVMLSHFTQFPLVMANCLCFIFQVFSLKQGPGLWNWWVVKALSEANENCRCPNTTEKNQALGLI